MEYLENEEKIVILKDGKEVDMVQEVLAQIDEESRNS